MKDRRADLQPWWTRLPHLAFLAPVTLTFAGAATVLQAPVNPYDGGLVLTLSRFTSLSLLPYRDLWTLYGPGPPVYGSIIMRLFGPGTVPVRLGFLAVQAALALVVFLLAQRFVGRWTSIVFAAPVATIAASQFHFHFAWSILLILSGIWFVLRAEERPRHRTVLASVGAFLMGASFWGRYEFLPFGVLMVLLTWWWQRSSLGPGARWVAIAGLAPSVAFVAFLVTIVGPHRLWLDLIEYPARYYPRAACRGLPPVWGEAWNALIAPLKGRVWTGQDVVLSLGTFGPPIVAAAVLGLGLLRRRERDARGLAMLVAGCCLLFMWLEHRARAAGEPQPVWAPMMVAAAMVTAFLRRRWAVGLTVGVVGVMVGLTLVTSWAPAHLPAWLSWPSYDRLYGFADLDETFMFDRGRWTTLTRVVHRYAGPDEPVFVALGDNTGHFANMAVLYWVVDRPPGSRYMGLAPCLTDRPSVQLEMIDELDDTDVVIQTPYFGQEAPPFWTPSTVLDDYFREHFEVVHSDSVLHENDLLVLVRRSERPAGAAVGYSARATTSI